MILVSGTGRCGTSMWMQILAAAGFPIVGEAFPRNWEQNLRAANPRGFYESTLVDGVNFLTNPDPRTGARLVPEDTRSVVAKVFLNGVRRTERAFLDRVLVSVRSWRAVVASVARLDELEEAAAGVPLPSRGTETAARAWFLEHVAVLEDAARRGYALRFVAYDEVLAEPRDTVADVLGWLVGGEEASGGQALDPARATDAAVAAIQPGLRTYRADEPPPVELPTGWAEAFDALYARLCAGTAHDPGYRQEARELAARLGARGR